MWASRLDHTYLLVSMQVLTRGKNSVVSSRRSNPCPIEKPFIPNSTRPTPPTIPRLTGGKCRACGYVFFPPQRYGCESCGAPPEKLEAAELRGCGRLHSYATVHLYQGKDIEAPFTVGLIVLDDGPAIRSILTDRTDEGLAIGDRMAACWSRPAPIPTAMRWSSCVSRSEADGDAR